MVAARPEAEWPLALIRLLARSAALNHCKLCARGQAGNRLALIERPQLLALAQLLLCSLQVDHNAALVWGSPKLDSTGPVGGPTGSFIQCAQGTMEARYSIVVVAVVVVFPASQAASDRDQLVPVGCCCYCSASSARSAGCSRFHRFK